jgi:hypothetical protein
MGEDARARLEDPEFRCVELSDAEESDRRRLVPVCMGQNALEEDVNGGGVAAGMSAWMIKDKTRSYGRCGS